MSSTNKNVRKQKPKQYKDEHCQAVRHILSLVGDKWSILVVAVLESGTKRFSEVQHSIEGISQRMLTRTLRELELYGLLTRRVEPTIPPSVYYSLTSLGKTLLVPVKALADWAKDNQETLKKAYMQHNRDS